MKLPFWLRLQLHNFGALTVTLFVLWPMGFLSMCLHFVSWLVGLIAKRMERVYLRVLTWILASPTPLNSREAEERQQAEARELVLAQMRKYQQQERERLH